MYSDVSGIRYTFDESLHVADDERKFVNENKEKKFNNFQCCSVGFSWTIHLIKLFTFRINRHSTAGKLYSHK